MVRVVAGDRWQLPNPDQLSNNPTRSRNELQPLFQQVLPYNSATFDYLKI